jgi:UDP-N-acetyl-D-mannosaminuronic acid dehydrogenase
MGLSFKPDIDDLRESPAMYIASRILSESTADILVVEPNIEKHKTFNIVNYNEAYQKADIVVWLVAHSPFFSIAKDLSKVELDFCGIRK